MGRRSLREGGHRGPQARSSRSWACSPMARRSCWPARAASVRARRVGSRSCAISSTGGSRSRGSRWPTGTSGSGRPVASFIRPARSSGGWNHKITNILDDLPKKASQKAAELRKAMPYAETKADGEQRRDDFVRTYRKTEWKAVDTLLRDWERMVTFYSLPPGALAPSADHEHRGIPLLLGAAPHECVPPLQACGGAKAMIWKMLRVAEKSWRKLTAPAAPAGGLRRDVQGWCDDEVRKRAE